MRILHAVLIVGVWLVAPVQLAGAQQATPLAAAGGAAEPMSYEAWLHQRQIGDYWGTGPRGFYGLWDVHEPSEARAARVAAYWAGFAEDFHDSLHPRYYTFLDPDNPVASGRYAAPFPQYQQRFLDEARAAGEIVIAFEGRSEPGGLLRTVYGVFAIGTPPERVERSLHRYLLQRNFYLEGEEMLAVLNLYRGSVGLEPRTQLPSIRDTNYDGHPAPTYEEWLYKVYQPRGIHGYGAVYWPHDEPLEVRAARNAAAWERRREFGFMYTYTWGPFLFPPYYMRVTIGGDELDDRFRARWVREARAAGDIVIPLEGQVLPEPRNADLPTGAYFVFAAGAPPDQIEYTIRSAFGAVWRYNTQPPLSPEEIEAIIRVYRSVADLPLPG